MNEIIKILIVEDTPSDVELLHRALRRGELNFVSEVVQTRQTFEDGLKRFVPDIVLSDFSLPSFDGISAFRIKQNYMPEVPFIIVSGTIGEENAVELIKSGVTDYAIKDKLFTLPQKITRALHDAEEKKEKQIVDAKFKFQYQKLLEIAFLQSHQVRAPIAAVLGLINLFNFDNPNDSINSEIIRKLQYITLDFDNLISEIVKKTSEIEQIH